LFATINLHNENLHKKKSIYIFSYIFPHFGIYDSAPLRLRSSMFRLRAPRPKHTRSLLKLKGPFLYKQFKVPFPKERVTRPLIESAVLFLPKNSGRSSLVASAHFKEQGRLFCHFLSCYCTDQLWLVHSHVLLWICL
jgi:hypothetical protein